jgi:ATP-dependent RNA helicase DHX8/PRP22
MLEYTVPELLRVNLTHTILQLKAMGIDDVMHFGYMEEPDENQLLDGLKSLFLLKAIDEDGKITPLGKMLSQFPLEPSYGKALLSSMLFDCEEDMINLVSLLSTE